MELIGILTSVSLIWGIAAITPGPNFFVTAQVAASGSRYAALYTVVGITLGTFLWGICGFLGVQAVFMAAPWLYLVLKFAGGSYLVFLGLRLLQNNRKWGRREGHVHTNSISTRKLFRLGFITNLSNPKTAAFVASLFAATTTPSTSYLTGILSVGIMTTISLFWYTSVACVFSLPRVQQKYRGLQIIIDRIAGIVFIGFGARLMTTD